MIRWSNPSRANLLVEKLTSSRKNWDLAFRTSVRERISSLLLSYMKKSQMRKRKKSLPMLSGPRIILSLTRVKSRLPSKLWGSFRMIFQLSLICILKNPKMPWQKLSRTLLRFKKVSKRSQKITDLWVEDPSKWSEMGMDLFHQDVELKENQDIRIDFLLDQVVDKKLERKFLPKFQNLLKENLFPRVNLHKKVSES